MGLVGAGFVGPHHVDAVRRLGFVDIVAVAGSTETSGRQKAETIGARRGAAVIRRSSTTPTCTSSTMPGPNLTAPRR